ncbi:hypothetical protein L596_005960 [Steinernema carpocapsae]|uniref:Uncharacterized protein n=1 Tax=Steinernema carpocapsae TaxID=34508 RepID=A0A4U8V5L5_STECR|nr:hypothetical protein L596_005960 [Steinernema carpocapsae]
MDSDEKQANTVAPTPTKHKATSPNIWELQPLDNAYSIPTLMDSEEHEHSLRVSPNRDGSQSERRHLRQGKDAFIKHQFITFLKTHQHASRTGSGSAGISAKV